VNTDVEAQEPGWLEAMLGLAQLPDVGAVGAKLLYPNRTIQHAGVIIGLGGTAGHAFVGLEEHRAGYLMRAICPQGVSAVTGACLLVKKDLYEQMCGLDEQLTVDFNDVDFCLRLQNAGYQNLWTPQATLIHHESMTRTQKKQPPEQKERYRRERALFRERHHKILQEGDPYYGKGLSLETGKSYQPAGQAKRLMKLKLPFNRRLSLYRGEKPFQWFWRVQTV
jgi:GT2 family glycosyltransferase